VALPEQEVSLLINRWIRSLTLLPWIFLKITPDGPRKVQELELLSKPPLQLNSLVRQVRIDNGQRSESTFKITTYKVCEKLVFEGVSNAYRCSYDFVTTNPPTSTQVTFTFELLKLELFMLPFEKLIHIAVQEGAKRTVRNLKNLIESS
jgi:hypothetical protein